MLGILAANPREQHRNPACQCRGKHTSDKQNSVSCPEKRMVAVGYHAVSLRRPWVVINPLLDRFFKELAHERGLKHKVFRGSQRRANEKRLSCCRLQVCDRVQSREASLQRRCRYNSLTLSALLNLVASGGRLDQGHCDLVEGLGVQGANTKLVRCSTWISSHLLVQLVLFLPTELRG